MLRNELCGCKCETEVDDNSENRGVGERGCECAEAIGAERVDEDVKRHKPNGGSYEFTLDLEHGALC